MTKEQIDSLKSAFEFTLRSLEYPMYIMQNVSDERLRRSVGELSASMISKIDFEIVPYLEKMIVDE